MATPTTLLDGSTLAGGQTGSGGSAGVHLSMMGPKGFASFPLPAGGTVIVGRGGGAGVDVKLDDAKASRRHLRLHIGDGTEVDVEDLGSANGTRVRDHRIEPGVRVRVGIGEEISIGSVTLTIQPNRSVRLPPRGLPLAHDEFRGRVDWECARADATGGTFSIARVQGPPGAGADGSPLRANDIIGCAGPGEWELLLPGIAGETAQSLTQAFARQFARAGAARVGVASYPDDGRHASALLARATARARNQAKPEAVDDGRTVGMKVAIASVDENMRRVQGLAERAAAGDINVLVLGETGVGKEVLVREIHAASARGVRPMACINCAALSLSLLESELFGHERGAFTGAGEAKPGLLETAPGGTIFLDEIGDMPPPLQAKLLRVIETREVLRVGGVRPRKIDVRFIAATNLDLEAEIARGTFRADLFHRLNGITLTIPPLRDRPRDIPVLANAFVVRSARTDPGPLASPRHISEAAMAALRAYKWPGNVRELYLVIERALLLSDGPELLLEHLPQRLSDVTDSVEAPPVAAPPAPATVADERARILAALAACGGNQSRAARQLGISRKVLIARLDRYGTARPRKPGAK